MTRLKLVPDLDRCPWCGADARLGERIGNRWAVACSNSMRRCYVNPATQSFRDKLVAVKAWNRRSENKTPEAEP